ncbi:replication initiator [Nonomuraea sp. NPDC050790]|uniref:replication initiator n=1 Tax=Nonomuraea sp. NPDC050790 TaxID=3364371 RepID=UPI0037A71B29
MNTNGWMHDLANLINSPGYARWKQMVAATGGCAHPIHLTGSSTIIDAATGEVLHDYQAADEPGGHLLIACGNRRASVCPACSQLYQADTYHLIRAGLSGGKGIPDSITTHPRAFVTLTAPSFGPVHSHRNGQPCRPRRHAEPCPHGRPIGCHARHQPHDGLLGQPLCPDCYDYPGAVLWQAHAGALWHRFTQALRRHLAAHIGLSRRAFAGQVRVAFAKVAEYQRRGLVHFHAVIRLDGHGQPPPAWADHSLLSEAIPAAAHSITLTSPASDLGQWHLTWGDQLDIRPITVNGDLSERAVASYIAKYATKGAEASGTIDHRLSCRACAGHGRQRPLTTCPQCHGTGLKPGLHLDALPVTDHARRMIRTCWDLGARPEYAALRLRPWAHMLGFRGHFSSKSRTYSTTLTALRDARRQHRAAEARDRHQLPAVTDATTLILAHWRFAGIGHTPAEALMAEHIRHNIATARKIAAEREDG